MADTNTITSRTPSATVNRDIDNNDGNTPTTITPPSPTSGVITDSDSDDDNNENSR
ncbi:MAG: hypothetical protein Q9210_005617 [Variospora velana]